MRAGARMVGLPALLALLTLVPAGRLRARPQWVYVDQGQSWMARGLGTCDGDEQSPIAFADVSSMTTIGIPDLEQSARKIWYKYPPVGYPLKMANDGHTVSITFPEQYKAGLGVSTGLSTTEMLVESNFFRLWKLNVHHPSEHLKDGNSFPLELQLIHQNPTTKQTGIMAIWVAEGKPNALLDEMLKGGLPQNAFEELTFNTQGTPANPAFHAVSKGLSIGDLFLKQDGTVDTEGVYAYNGSLTEPPCEQPVRWWVRRNPIEASLEQIEKFAAFIKKLNGPAGNVRMLQQRNERKAELMAIVDPLAEELPAQPTVAASGITAAAAANPCAALAEFESLNPTGAEPDSEDVIAAKEKYSMAQQEADGAGVWEITAKQALATVQGLYDAAPGPVEKIHLKWTIIEKQTDYANAQARKAATTATASAACDDALPIVCGASTSTECVVAQASLALAYDVTPAPVANAVSPQPAVVVTPVDHGLDYRPSVSLPSGAAGNPFSNTMAENAARIGGSGMPYQVDTLSNSLRQPLTPHAALPMPAMDINEPAATTAAATDAAAAAATTAAAAAAATTAAPA